MAVSVKDIRDSADRIAQKAEEAERQYQACQEAYARYEALQAEVRELTIAFNALAQQLTAAPAATPNHKEEPDAQAQTSGNAPARPAA